MTPTVLGLHHVTAICSEPQRNLDFYAGVLGLRLVKRTVNFDDPRTHHFYFGDAAGRPGSVITFFAWPDGRGGRQGTGQAAAVALSVVPNAIGYWVERLGARGVRYERPARRLGEQAIAFRDPDGLMLELVAHERAAERGPAAAWPGAPVPAEHAVRGLHGVALWEDGNDATAGVLAEVLGMRPAAEAESVTRYEAGAGGPGAYVDLRNVAGFWPGTEGTGVVHHVAYRVADDAALAELRERVVARGLVATPPIDRLYFRSVYFREPGGVLFELATDAPGFAVDEPADQLGEHFVLPPWLEGMRAELEAQLPRVRPPHENVPVAEGTSVFRQPTP
ncbi:MAG TPA: ring-cleaving dioxygenase [Gemmatimonadaceae bacterium]|nr:ring-cleaving dioxygenase [Gemmatimonadaceae bacterium]